MVSWYDHPATLPFACGLLASTLFVWRSYLLVWQGRHALRHKHQEHESLFAHNVDGVAALDAAGVVQRANEALCRLTGTGEDEMRDRPFAELFPPAAAAVVRTSLAGVLDGRQNTVEVELLRPGDDAVTVDLTCVPIVIGRDVVGAYGILRDTTERRRLQDELEDRALHDYLTGLPNRALFADRLAHALQRRRRDGGRLALFYVDLDRFKPINDRAGHKVGDRLLCDIAVRLRSLVREGDTVARLGGDEFAVLLETVEGERQALAAAQRIVSLIRSPLVVDGQEFQVGASVGVAISSAETEEPEQLVHQADLAMYEAKRLGGFQHRIYSPGLEQDGSDFSLRLEGELRRAIEKDELDLRYQPIVDTDGARIVGLEALVRWEHAELGNLMPASFIPIAENSSLIAELDRWVLERSCREIRRLIEFGIIKRPFSLSVNLSARHFDEPDFTSAISDILLRTRLDPSFLQVEITESSAGGDPRKVRGLKDLGVKVAIDDFGTGFSSLSYLRDLDVDVLKVDKSFVLALGADPAAGAIVRTILTLAEMLNLEVIVEGIEQPAQLAHLEELGGSALVQGFLFGHPVTVEALPGLVSRGLAATLADGLAASPQPGGARSRSPAVRAPLPKGVRGGVPDSPRRWESGLPAEA